MRAGEAASSESLQKYVVRWFRSNVCKYANRALGLHLIRIFEITCEIIYKMYDCTHFSVAVETKIPREIVLSVRGIFSHHLGIVVT